MYRWLSWTQPEPVETSAHLLRYDGVHGRFSGKVTVNDNSIDLRRAPIEVMSTYDLRELEWSGYDVVLEWKGKFNDRKTSAVHIQRGTKAVLISAPAKNVDKTIVYGVNHRDLIFCDTMVSNGSCTTCESLERFNWHRRRNYESNPFLHWWSANIRSSPQRSPSYLRGSYGYDSDLNCCCKSAWRSPSRIKR